MENRNALAEPGERRTAEGIRLHPPADFAGMHAAGRLVARCLDMIGAHVVPGVRTEELDERILAFVEAEGARSATIGYRGYRHASCISVNHVVCHGIPGPKRLKDGDILNIDVTAVLDGWYGDTSRMYVAGEPTRKAARLIEVTHEALMRGIAAVRPGDTFGHIGHAIQSYAEAERCSVVRDFCGHGVGRVRGRDGLPTARARVCRIFAERRAPRTIRCTSRWRCGEGWSRCGTVTCSPACAGRSHWAGSARALRSCTFQCKTITSI